jgi:hypothetical protein
VPKSTIPGSTEQQRAAFTQAVGECIMTWAMVERCLTVLYCECIGCPPGSPNFPLQASIFDTVISIDARLAMLQTALEPQSRRLMKPNPTLMPLFSEWKTTLRKKIRKNYDKRNEVAHSDIEQTGMADGSQLVRLATFTTLTKGMLSSGQTLLSIDQLHARAEEFKKLSGEIVNFMGRVRDLQNLPDLAFESLGRKISRNHFGPYLSQGKPALFSRL